MGIGQSEEGERGKGKGEKNIMSDLNNSLFLYLYPLPFNLFPSLNLPIPLSPLIPLISPPPTRSTNQDDVSVFWQLVADNAI